MVPSGGTVPQKGTSTGCARWI